MNVNMGNGQKTGKRLMRLERRAVRKTIEQNGRMYARGKMAQRNREGQEGQDARVNQRKCVRKSQYENLLLYELIYKLRTNYKYFISLVIDYIHPTSSP